MQKELIVLLVTKTVQAFVAAHGEGSIFVAPCKYSKSLLVVAHGKYSAAVIGVALSKYSKAVIVVARCNDCIVAMQL